MVSGVDKSTRNITDGDILKVVRFAKSGEANEQLATLGLARLFALPTLTEARNDLGNGSLGDEPIDYTLVRLLATDLDWFPIGLRAGVNRTWMIYAARDSLVVRYNDFTRYIEKLPHTVEHQTIELSRDSDFVLEHARRRADGTMKQEAIDTLMTMASLEETFPPRSLAGIEDANESLRVIKSVLGRSNPHLPAFAGTSRFAGKIPDPQRETLGRLAKLSVSLGHHAQVVVAHRLCDVLVQAVTGKRTDRRVGATI